jgi:hypothetical protein
MATPDSTYGRSIRCVSDADELFSACEGLDTVFQDIIHRLTTDSILGPNGADWGRDFRKMLGMSVAEARLLGPAANEVASRDPRVITADIEIEITESADGTVADARIAGTVTTSLGPFEFVLPISQVTDATMRVIP